MTRLIRVMASWNGRPIFLAALIALCAFPAWGQWRMVANKLTGAMPVENTAITYNEGIVWAGCTSLWRSNDSGLTWDPVPLTLTQITDRIVDIQFLDSLHGLVITYFDAFLTKDGGKTWLPLLDNEIDGAASGCFVGSASLLAVSDFGGDVLRSTDAGNNWTTNRLDTNASQITFHNGNLYVITSYYDNLVSYNFFGLMYKSTDLGVTWQGLSGSFDPDSYSIAFDSCGKNEYLTNEGYSNPIDSNSRVIVSSDDGASWQSSFVTDPMFVSGSVAAGGQCIFASTTTGGVLRFDGGTWSPIGGPNSGIDQRSLCVISDSLILAVDSEGSIWRTANSGSFPILNVYQAPRATPNSLFAGDTVPPCSAETRIVVIQPYSGFTCSPPTILSQQIIGPDSIYYQLTRLAAPGLTAVDSDQILFAPSDTRNYSATLKITLDNGQVLHVALGGCGADTIHIVLNMASIVTDTIGDLTIPIEASGLSEALNVRLSYDNSALEYKGTFDAAGTKIDETEYPGSVWLRIVPTGGILSNEAAGFAHFGFFPTAQRCAWLKLDSARLSDTSLCATIVGDSISICLDPFVCGTSLLSSFLRTGTPPVFFVTPNPSSGMISVSADKPVSGASIDVINSIGTIELRTTADLGPTPVALDLGALPAGMKFVRITTPDDMRTVRVILSR